MQSKHSHKPLVRDPHNTVGQTGFQRLYTPRLWLPKVFHLGYASSATQIQPRLPGVALHSKKKNLSLTLQLISIDFSINSLINFTLSTASFPQFRAPQELRICSLYILNSSVQSILYRYNNYFCNKKLIPFWKKNHSSVLGRRMTLS